MAFDAYVSSSIYSVGASEGLRIELIAMNFGAMAAKRLNVICRGEKCALRYFPGTETAALVHAVTARFRLDGTSFYLSEPELDEVVPLSSTLPNGFTVVVHAVDISAPALAWDRKAIEVNVNAADDVTDCIKTELMETEEEVVWPTSDECQEREDEDAQDRWGSLAGNDDYQIPTTGSKHPMASLEIRHTTEQDNAKPAKKETAR